ncbi:MAG: hypothetical protein CMA63_03595 [Euryarchaeota archaeon]|nr:hypothetical protein [Euryarchaeota archaeon]
MSKAREYYDGLMSQGYAEPQAMQFTQQYYPDFSLMPSAPEMAPAPLPAPVASNPYAPQPVGTTQIGQREPEGFNPYAPVTGTSQNASSSKSTVSSGLPSMPKMNGLSMDKMKETFSDKKVLAISGAVIIAILLGVVAFMISSNSVPLEGTWINSDGQKSTFHEDNSYTDGTNLSSMWNLDGDDLTLISTGQQSFEIFNETQVIDISLTQHITVSFSSDEKALWMKVDSVESNGEVTNSSDGCILLLKTSVASNQAQYDTEASNYQDETPDMCSSEVEE